MLNLLNTEFYKLFHIDCIFAVAYLAIQISSNKTANPQSIKTDSRIGKWQIRENAGHLFN